ncbi:carbonic anhydrase 15-like [Candoia aspera]|uniref:carbonic anhydrase 15-like n=1 Tax=Candoia aspera TaxID=51853 RepID=UPI002FD7D6A1
MASGLWCYDSQDPKCGPSHWKEITSGCGGQNQSPINIDRRKARRDRSLDGILFEGYDQAPPGRWRLVNSGDEVKMILDGASAAEQINITRGGMRDTYRAFQFHFHWGDLKRNGSEHYMDGIQFPMELHIVHMNTKYKTVSEAKEHPNGLAVLSFLFQISDTDNTNYNTVVASLRNISRAGEYVDMASTFSLSNLLPSLASLSKYYRYQGSLTTPNCEEVVIWTVFEEQIPISRSQLNAFVDTTYFKNLAGMPQKMINNFRPLQLLNGRTVYASRYATISCGSSLAANLFLPLLLSCLTGQFSGSS